MTELPSGRCEVFFVVGSLDQGLASGEMLEVLRTRRPRLRVDPMTQKRRLGFRPEPDTEAGLELGQGYQVCPPLSGKNGSDGGVIEVRAARHLTEALSPDSGLEPPCDLLGVPGRGPRHDRAVSDTLSYLQQELRAVGMTLYHVKASVEIRPIEIGGDQNLRALLRDQLASRGLTLADGRVLSAVAAGELEEWRLSPSENMALQRLRRMGIVSTDDDELTEAGRLSLALDRRPRPELE